MSHLISGECVRHSKVVLKNFTNSLLDRNYEEFTRFNLYYFLCNLYWYVIMKASKNGNNA